MVWAFAIRWKKVFIHAKSSKEAVMVQTDEATSYSAQFLRW